MTRSASPMSIPNNGTTQSVDISQSVNPIPRAPACNHTYNFIKILEISYPYIIEIARFSGIAMEDIITNPKILIDSHIIPKTKKYYLNILYVLRFEGGCFQSKQYDKI